MIGSSSDRTLLASSSSSSSSRSLAPRNVQLNSRRARLNAAARPNVTPISTQEQHHKRRARPNAASAQPSSATASAQEALEQRQGFSARPRTHLSTFQLLSAELSIAAATQRFERLAGRSAMIGVLVAVFAELLTESSIFRHFSPDTVTFLGSLVMGAVSLAAAAAFASRHKLGLELLEAVVTSLTANQRSAASVTGQQVDSAVDSVLNRVFDQSIIYSILADEEDI